MKQGKEVSDALRSLSDMDDFLDQDHHPSRQFVLSRDSILKLKRAKINIVTEALEVLRHSMLVSNVDLVYLIPRC